MQRPLFRHGDVLLQAITPPPAGQLQRQNHLTLAYGEVTGHTHRIAQAHAAALYAMSGPSTDQYLHVTEPLATLVHEEHGPIELPQGWYRVWQQREYTPGSVRTVLD